MIRVTVDVRVVVRVSNLLGQIRVRVSLGSYLGLGQNKVKVGVTFRP